MIISLLAAMQAKAAADQLNQQATLYAQHASVGLPTRGGSIFHFLISILFYFFYQVLLVEDVVEVSYCVLLFVYNLSIFI
jgi:hypothetical protein